jgi:hypothetical protein
MPGVYVQMFYESPSVKNAPILGFIYYCQKNNLGSLKDS